MVGMIEKVIAIVLGLLSIVGILYIGLKMKLQNDFDDRYMTSKSCEDKHKVTDTMLASVREDLKEIKEAVKAIHDVMFTWVKDK